ncbi:MAG TPA: hypothetical protein VFJ06_01235 [Halococcus sp.]|nr:hypothetical protein [Halococcus sp.]
MQTVRDETGRKYLLLKRSAESSRVRDPETGEERYLDNARLEAVSGESALVTASQTVPESVRTVMTAVHDDRILGLLCEIDSRGPLSVRELLEYDLCESDLHGVCAELRAAGLIEECEVATERGYRTTDLASEALSHVRESAD